ncbi:Eco57I restriction-modification methylase domain-containing protein [Mycolicibacillus trivialis]|uniref:site-specific DNA-methyltransferase (adenine-specific) n=1 Tax=Mycolicibacillus trivialis TaxID=1798 RepID=A0A1X2EJX0_9MYCO|nr:Eco57I restriction-modification methylase domain-containing protein [Mycolicibacillus trivialis]ORX04515.1 restriction endonuclease [Mycolicibacillus trivialis]
MVTDFLDLAEQQRVDALAALDAATQDKLGQFFTPIRAAVLIASMPRMPESNAIRVLDPGAGSGSLSAALVSRVLTERPDLAVHVVAAETDQGVLDYLTKTLDMCVSAGDGRVTYEIVAGDFIAESTGLAPDPRLRDFDIVIQNPPYAKLAASSAHREAVREVGADAPNLYAAFLALGAAALVHGGQLVAITPRSFCNGPYFGLFRSFLLDRIALDRIHVFESRNTVFADTGVLQENVIFSGTCDGARDEVVLSMSVGHTDEVTERVVPYDEVVQSNDPQRFIRLAVNAEDTAVAERMLSLPATLAELRVTASTGKVVDFRSRECLQSEPTEGALPLIYPGNLRGGVIEHPREIRKAQWFEPHTDKDNAMLVPEGWYCVVKRFSSKEERRRIVAAVWSPERISGAVAFENHLNVFHHKGGGLDRDLAHGLCWWLNSTLVDQFFRTFSGHTQVNATDLRTLRFPTVEALREVGRDVPSALPDQETIDARIAAVLDVNVKGNAA